LWDRYTRERYGVEDPLKRRFRYGVQVNSLGLTAQQPENNVQRIVLEMLAVVLSKEARARSVQLPAWNEALGLPRPWDQQWSLRTADAESILVVDPEEERQQIERLRAFRAARNAAEAEAALQALADAAKTGTNIMPASIRAAHAGVTTGEWAGMLRKVFGEYR